MIKCDVVIVGAGPAGLAASIEAAKAGASVYLVDENNKPGGQLFKQIHKFFGSHEHRAGTRGVKIGADMCAEAEELGVNVLLSSVVFNISEKSIHVSTPDGTEEIVAGSIILGTGAMENCLSFKGWNKPGVMGAGAAQTMININRVLPGQKIIMLGSGNVGLIVTYQLLQAGADVVGIVEALPKIGGYAVHAGKVKRAGVPIYTSHTILEVKGENEVTSVVLAEVENFKPIPGTEIEIEADTVCMAVGLTPLAELAWMTGCSYTFSGKLGGFIPLHDENMETSVSGMYVAGDISGIEEASTAIDEGRLAGVAAVQKMGLMKDEEAEEKKAEIRARLDSLRKGPFGEARAEIKKNILAERRALCR
jgi:thioredoxin reductase